MKSIGFYTPAESGEVVVMNSNRLAFEEFQHRMAGEAENAGLNSEQDVVDLVKEVRKRMREAPHEGNA